MDSWIKVIETCSYIKAFLTPVENENYGEFHIK